MGIPKLYPLILSIAYLTALAQGQGDGLLDQAPAPPGRVDRGGSEETWQQWEEWSGCSVTCDEGIRVRVRECSSVGACPGSRLEIDSCQVGAVCPRYSEWSTWTPCTSTCGFGAKERSRTCDQTACPGPNKDFAQCDYGCPCPWAGWRPNQKITFNKWGSWQPWQECSATCGPGKRQRCRKCDKGSVCTGPISETEPCDGGYCRPDPPAVSWGNWGSWNPCSVSCGRGVELRERPCMGGRGGDCPGINAEERECDKGPCSGYEPRLEWASWGFWGACSASCDGGRKERQRQCRGGSAAECGGNSVDSQSCNEQPCSGRPQPTRPSCIRCPPRFTQAPWTQAPWTQAPWTQAPWTQAPWTQAPWTQAPVPQGMCPWQWSGWSPCMGGCNGVRARQPTCGSCGGTCSAARTNQLRPCNQGCAKTSSASQVNSIPSYYPQTQQRYGYVRYAYGLPGSQGSYSSGAASYAGSSGGLYMGGSSAYGGASGNYQYLNYLGRR